MTESEGMEPLVLQAVDAMELQVGQAPRGSIAGVDETGELHGTWRVLARDEGAPGYWFWRCRCEGCGFERVLAGVRLRASPPRCVCQGGTPSTRDRIYRRGAPSWRPSQKSEPHSADVIRRLERDIEEHRRTTRR